jgi:hypothetical protein
MGLTSCRWITITEMIAHRRRECNRHQAGCRVAVERAADRYTLICDGPVILQWVAVISACFGAAFIVLGILMALNVVFTS